MGCNIFLPDWVRNIVKNSHIDTIITDNEIFINGQKIPSPPCPLNNTTIINNKIYVNGYEYKNGAWKKTLAALWHKYF